MIKLFFALFVIIPFLHAEEDPVNYIKCRRGAFSSSDYFLMKEVTDKQDTWYVMNSTKTDPEEAKTNISSSSPDMLPDIKSIILSIEKEDLSSCLENQENKVSTYFPSNLKLYASEINKPTDNNVFKCFCKAKPKMLNECGFLYRRDPYKILRIPTGGDYLNILYCRNGETTDERILDQMPFQQIAKFNKKIVW